MEKKKERKPVKRSPGYPMISLKDAIGKALILWNKDGSNPMPVAAVYDHLGYKQAGGYAARIVAALKKFDLISESRGAITLTENAINLALHKPDNESYKDTLKKIAVKPAVYRIIFDQFNGNIPSDETLRIKLIQEYGFNHKSVDDFIDKFKETIKFAELTQGEVQAEDGKEGQENMTGATGQPKIPCIKVNGTGNTEILKSYDIPLNDNHATISFKNLPLDREDLEDLKRWIDFFGNKLIKKESPPDGQDT